jgi:hypothetical protein
MPRLKEPKHRKYLGPLDGDLNKSLDKVSLKCYRVWFSGGTAMLLDAQSELAARTIARKHIDPKIKIKSVECLGGE